MWRRCFEPTRVQVVQYRWTISNIFRRHICYRLLHTWRTHPVLGPNAFTQAWLWSSPDMKWYGLFCDKCSTVKFNNWNSAVVNILCYPVVLHRLKMWRRTHPLVLQFVCGDEFYRLHMFIFYIPAVLFEHVWQRRRRSRTLYTCHIHL